MRLSSVLIKFFCISTLCALAMMFIGSSEVFASTTRATADSPCLLLVRGSVDSATSNPPNQVSNLQKKLSNLGYNLGPYGVDGKFGQDTYNDVYNFQSANHLQSLDGEVGPETWGKLGGCDPVQLKQPGTSQPSTPPPTARVVVANVGKPEMYQCLHPMDADHTQAAINASGCAGSSIAPNMAADASGKLLGYVAYCQKQGDLYTISINVGSSIFPRYFNVRSNMYTLLNSDMDNSNDANGVKWVPGVYLANGGSGVGLNGDCSRVPQGTGQNIINGG